jgi:hypothetical protein
MRPRKLTRKPGHQEAAPRPRTDFGTEPAHHPAPTPAAGARSAPQNKPSAAKPPTPSPPTPQGPLAKPLAKRRNSGALLKRAKTA